MQLSKLNYEKLLAAASHAKAETERANDAEERAASDESALKNLREQIASVSQERKALATKVSKRDEALVQLALRLSFHGDAEPIAGTE